MNTRFRLHTRIALAGPTLAGPTLAGLILAGLGLALLAACSPKAPEAAEEPAPITAPPPPADPHRYDLPTITRQPGAPEAHPTIPVDAAPLPPVKPAR